MPRGCSIDRPRPLSYGCRCSRSRLAGVLANFGEDDLDHMAQEDGAITMTCEFCNLDFRFDRAEVQAERTALLEPVIRGSAAPRGGGLAMPKRRALLLLPCCAAACAGQPEPVPIPPGPLSFRHLTPLPLNLASVEIAEDAPPAPPGDIGDRISPTAAEAIRIMARDRLLSRRHHRPGQFQRHPGAAACRPGLADLQPRLPARDPLSPRQPPGLRGGRSAPSVNGPEAKPAARAGCVAARAMDDLNVEFEFQLRRNLRDWISATVPGPDGGMAAPGPAGVAREDLP